MKPRILVIDDEPEMCDMLAVGLRRRDYEVESCPSPTRALAHLSKSEFDAVLTDIRMPEMDGLAFCEEAARRRPDVPVVVMTAFGSLENATAALRAGAYDFVTKPIEIDLLAAALARATDRHRLERRLRRLENAPEREFGAIVGESRPMRELYDAMRRVASSEATVLLSGESGTGKELVARALHAAAPRRNGPFVPINCAAIPRDLMESEFFGHTRGAFTGAVQATRGLIASAHDGTVFLDEVGDLPLALQPKLLRALEERCVRPVGGESEFPIDVRVIAATNRDLEHEVEQGRFRADLFYRLNVVNLELPPLRSRGTDVLLLAQHFIDGIAAREALPKVTMSRPFAEQLLDYPWPGNVRELYNALERALALRRFDQLLLEDLPARIRNHRSSQLVLAGDDPSRLVPLEEMERRYIFHVLRVVGGNRTLAARYLGLDRKTLYRKLLRYGPERSARDSDAQRR